MNKKITVNKLKCKRSSSIGKINNDEINLTNLTTKNSENLYIDNMLTRHKEKQLIKEKKIEEFKKRLDEEEMSHLKSLPTINKTKFRFDNENFYVRQEIKKSESLIKKRILVEKEIIKQHLILKSNPKLNQKKDDKFIKKKIDSMIEWKVKKEGRLKNLQDEENLKTSQNCTFTPEISQISKKLADEKIGSLSKKSVTMRLFNNEYIKTPRLTSSDNISTKCSKSKANSVMNFSKKNSIEKLNDVSFNLIRKESNVLKTNKNINYEHFNLNFLKTPKVTNKETLIIEELLKQKCFGKKFK